MLQARLHELLKGCVTTERALADAEGRHARASVQQAASTRMEMEQLQLRAKAAETREAAARCAVLSM